MTSVAPRRHCIPEAAISHRGDLSQPSSDSSSRHDASVPVHTYEERCDRLAIRALLPRAGGHLLDLGAGASRIVDEYDGFDAITYMNASPEVIGAARKRFGSTVPIAAMEWDAAHLPLPSASVDAVVAVRLLCQIGDPGELFDEIARVLRPGGSLIAEFADRRETLSGLRVLTGRLPSLHLASEPQLEVGRHFAHHRAVIETQLRDAGLSPDGRQSVFLLRSARLGSHVPARALAVIEGPLQRLLRSLAPGASVYVRSVRSIRSARVTIGSLRRAPTH